MNQPLQIRRDPDTRNFACAPMSLRTSSVDEQARTVEAVFATESRVTVFDFDTLDFVDEILIADGGEFKEQVPMLANHRRFALEDVLGSGRSIRKTGNQWEGVLHFAKDDDDADRAFNKVKQKHITDVSIGYRVLQATRIPPKQSATVDGRKFTAGERTLKIATKWRGHEISITPIGADEAAKIRSENQPARPAQPNGVTTMNPHLRKYLESIGLAATASAEDAQRAFDALTGEKRQQAELYRDGIMLYPELDNAGNQSRATPPVVPNDQQRSATDTPPVEPPAVDLDAVRREGAQAERERAEAIRDIGELAEVGEDAIRTAIADPEKTVAQVQREFLQAARERRQEPASNNQTPAVHSRDHGRDCTGDALGAGLIIRAGLPYTRIPVQGETEEERRTNQERLAHRGDPFRNMSMIDICRESLRLMGARHVPRNDSDMIKMAMRLSQAIEDSSHNAVALALNQRSGSTSSLSNIFTNVVTAQVLQSYEATMDTTQGWVREADVPNFKTNERYLMSKGNDLDVLPRGSEADHDTWDDSAETYKIARFAKQFGVDEQDIIDDMFNALLDKPQDMAEAAAQLRPNLVYFILMNNAALQADNVALFHLASHGNLRTGAGLSPTTLQRAIQDMWVQTQNGRTLNLRPGFLIVPAALKHTGSQLINSTEMRSTEALTSGGDQFGTSNPIREDNLSLRVDGRLDNGVTDPVTKETASGDTNNWYLAGRNMRNTIEVGYLRGSNRRPRVRSYVYDKGRWGIGWDINHDIGAKALDFRGLHRNEG